MSQRDIALAYRRALTGDNGALTPDGEVIMRDLEARCGWMVFSLPIDNDGKVDPYAAVAAVERRAVYSHVKTRLFGALPKE